MINNRAKLQRLEKEVLLLMSYKDKYEDLKNIIKGYKIKQLLELTAYLLDRRVGATKYSEYDLEFMIESLLSARVNCLNNYYDWFWNEEDKKRLSSVNNEIFNACEKGFQEALETAASLEKRIKKRDSFLKNYEIEIKITPYPTIHGVNRDAAETVGGFLGEESLPETIEHISHCHYHRYKKLEEFPIFLTDKTTNRSTGYYDKNFPGINICYLVHRMMDSSVWSYPDILSIRRVWADVKVTYQYFRNIPKTAAIN